MLSYLRHLRQKLLADNRFNKYLLYVFIEVFIVIIGILIAIQVDDWNEARKQRETEIHYLKNLKTDLLLNIDELIAAIHSRYSAIESATKILEYFEGKPLTDLEDFAYNAANVYGWQRYTQQTNTFQELINSGNLGLISNDSIKNGLLNLQSQYLKYKNVELHGRFDSEVMLYEPSYAILDLTVYHNIQMFPDSSGPSYDNRTLSRDRHEALLKDIKQKNGFSMMRFEFKNHIHRFNRMKEECITIIELIDRELEAENQ